MTLFHNTSLTISIDLTVKFSFIPNKKYVKFNHKIHEKSINLNPNNSIQLNWYKFSDTLIKKSKLKKFQDYSPHPASAEHTGWQLANIRKPWTSSCLLFRCWPNGGSSHTDRVSFRVPPRWRQVSHLGSGFELQISNVDCSWSCYLLSPYSWIYAVLLNDLMLF